jgi:hypothetical protein
MQTKHCPKLNCRCYRNKPKLNCRCYRITGTAKGKHQQSRRRSQRLPRRQWHPQHTKQQQVEGAMEDAAPSTHSATAHGEQHPHRRREVHWLQRAVKELWDTGQRERLRHAPTAGRGEEIGSGRNT